jgi:hypothetical protein
MNEVSARRVVADRMAAAASALLESLDGAQTELVAWPFPADDERHRWFYTPTDHGGLTLSSMRPGQQQLTMKLVASGLSRAGYVTVATIIGLENVLDELERWSMSWGRERGRDPGLYYVRIFGEPGADSPWAWRFGGHHVSINHVVVDGEVVSSTPCFLGADPASSPLLGPHLLRPLGGAEDLGRELVRSLDSAQLSLAILSPVPPVDLVTANRARVAEGDLPLPITDIWRARFEGEVGERLQSIQEQAERSIGLRPEHLDAVRMTAGPKGVPGSLLRPAQQEILRALLDVYTRRIPDAVADEEAAKYAGPLIEGMSFSWAGGVEPGQPHYYRIEGSRMLAEYDNTQRGANHVHAVWRDLDGDFGDDILARHYSEASHHAAP